MNTPRDEGYFFIDGQKNPVHCLLMKRTSQKYLSDFHYHKYIEILFGIDCDNLVWIDEKLHPFKSGDICFINNSKPHYVYSNADYSEYIVIKFSPELLSYKGQTVYEMKYIMSMLENNNFNKIITKDQLKKSNIPTIVKNIYDEWNKKDNGYEFAVRGGILQLFSEFIRIWEKRGNMIELSKKDEISEIIFSASDYAMEHLAYISEKEIAEKFNMSYSYFSRKFKSIMGRSFTSFINEMKTDEAKRLLLTTDKTITEIASLTGYSTTSHLISCFSSVFSMTPLQYRKKYKSSVEKNKIRIS